MKDGKLQAKDISDADALAALARCRGIHGVPHWSTLRDTQRELPQFPEKVVRAKLASMVRRKVIKGCACGCRGDFHLPDSESPLRVVTESRSYRGTAIK